MKKTIALLLSIALSIAMFFLLISYRLPKPTSIPILEVSEVLAHKENYIDSIICVSGFLEFKDIVRWTVLLPHVYYSYNSEGYLEAHADFQWIEKEFCLFYLHEDNTENSSYITIITKQLFDMYSLHFWYSPSGEEVITQLDKITELGYADGTWQCREVREFGKLWCLEV